MKKDGARMGLALDFAQRYREVAGDSPNEYVSKWLEERLELTDALKGMAQFLLVRKDIMFTDAFSTYCVDIDPKIKIPKGSRIYWYLSPSDVDGTYCVVIIPPADMSGDTRGLIARVREIKKLRRQVMNGAVCEFDTGADRHAFWMMMCHSNFVSWWPSDVDRDGADKFPITSGTYSRHKVQGYSCHCTDPITKTEVYIRAFTPVDAIKKASELGCDEYNTYCEQVVDTKFGCETTVTTRSAEPSIKYQTELFPRGGGVVRSTYTQDPESVIRDSMMMTGHTGIDTSTPTVTVCTHTDVESGAVIKDCTPSHLGEIQSRIALNEEMYYRTETISMRKARTYEIKNDRLYLDGHEFDIDRDYNKSYFINRKVALEAWF